MDTKRFQLNRNGLRCGKPVQISVIAREMGTIELSRYGCHGERVYDTGGTRANRSLVHSTRSHRVAKGTVARQGPLRF